MKFEKDVEEFKKDVRYLILFVIALASLLSYFSDTLANSIIAASTFGMFFIAAMTLTSLISNHIRNKGNSLNYWGEGELFTLIYKKQISIIKEVEGVYSIIENKEVKEKLLYLYGDSLQCINGILRDSNDKKNLQLIDDEFLMTVYEFSKLHDNLVLNKTISDYLSLKRTAIR